ncbi:MAG TPA: hypothetical protein VJ837_03100, partial [Candidatus Paceibacterota bacterium]|nr:hypothetical protein [Candidatus Paceibacterota bacterium]
MLTHDLLRHGDWSRHGDRGTRGRGVVSKTAPRLRVTTTPRFNTASLIRRVAASLPLRVAILAIAALFLASCGSKPTDPRTVIPADALIYLESADLGATLSAVVDNPKFAQLAKSKPDLSVLRGVKVSIAVTGFETSEQSITEENAVLKFRPRFVAVTETNAWSWQTTGFVEDKLGEFVNEAYAGEVELEKTPRNDGQYYVWTSQDGQKAYAFQRGSLVYFGNDESAIERCLAVARGEAESIAKSAKITEGDRLAFGYISPEGVGQIANIAGVTLAMGASEEEEVKSFIATVLPQLLRNSVREITWTATRTDAGIEDRLAVRLDDESAHVFSETLIPANDRSGEIFDFVPAQSSTATRYVIRDPQIAWRSLLLTTKRKTDDTSAALIIAFSGSLFEPYGVEEPEIFLSSVGTPILTVKPTGDDDEVAVIAIVKDAGKIRSSLAKEIDFAAPPEKQFGADFWRSKDGEVGVGLIGETVVAGDIATVLKCLEAKQARQNKELAQAFAASDAVATTVASDP